ncbi:MAG: hypothetical protein DWQ10_02140 [Calditrichaeota bacterium]|nr:MAG: hypothetical protein DWQ10_02140 [Calditrichota bacterium]
MTKKFLVRLSKRLIWRFLLALPECFCISLEIFLRHHFGVRYLRWGNIITSFCGVIVAFVLFDFLYILAKPDWPKYMIRSNVIEATLILLFCALSIWHKSVMLYQLHQHQHHYSQCPGETMILWRWIRLPEVFLFRFFEPLLVFGIGLTLFNSQIDGLIAIWLIFSSIFLFIKRQIQFYAERTMILDLIDSRTRSERLRGALQQHNRASEEEVFTVEPVETPMQNQ